MALYPKVVVAAKSPLKILSISYALNTYIFLLTWEVRIKVVEEICKKIG